MVLRFIALSLLLAGLGWFLDQQQRTGVFKPVNDGFLDFLLANSRESFETAAPSADAENEVVLVEMREEQQQEYADWPPAPLDWQMLLKALRAYEPEVVLIPTPLNWGRPTPEFAPAVGEALVAFPSVVLGVETRLAEGEEETNSAAPAFLGNLGDAIPHFQEVTGDVYEAPRLSALITAPDPVARGTSELGILCQSGTEAGWRLPYAVRDQDHLLPTVLAQTLARCTRSPYNGGHRLKLGPGAGALLQDGSFVPLSVSGEFGVKPSTQVPTVNALNLMVGDLADGVSETDQARLRQARVLVIGPTRPVAPGQSPTLTQLYAQALAQALALPRITILPPPAQWGLWAVFIAGALAWMLRVSRSHVGPVWLLLTFLALTASILVFQGLRVWSPPTVPILLQALAALGAWMLHPKKGPPVKTSTPAPAEA